jgi:hypothetical protein
MASMMPPREAAAPIASAKDYSTANLELAIH